MTEIERLTEEVQAAETAVAEAEQAARKNRQRLARTEETYQRSTDVDERARLRSLLNELPVVVARLDRRAEAARRELEQPNERLQAKKQEAARMLAALQSLHARTQPGGMYDQMIQKAKDESARKIGELETSKADELASLVKNRRLYLEMAGPSPDLPEAPTISG
jgi:hypothetical protein